MAELSGASAGLSRYRRVPVQLDDEIVRRDVHSGVLHTLPSVGCPNVTGRFGSVDLGGKRAD